MYYYTEIESVLGKITLCSDGKSLKGLWPEHDKYFGDTIPEKMVRNDGLDIFTHTRMWLDDYFAGKQPDMNRLTVAPNGSVFRQCVWQLLKEIPYGQTTTYGKLAEKVAVLMGKKSSARAVGGAVGHNPVSIIIPCHRVVGSDGSLTGFAGGIDMKVWLLEHERADMSGLYVEKRGRNRENPTLTDEKI